MGKTANNKISVYNWIIYTIFIVATIIIAVIAYKDISNSFTNKFVIGYAIFIVIMGIYFLFYTISNMRKFNWLQIRRLLVRFLIYFIIFWASDILITYLIKGEVNVFEKMAVPLGVALGITFLPAKNGE